MLSFIRCFVVLFFFCVIAGGCDQHNTRSGAVSGPLPTSPAPPLPPPDPRPFRIVSGADQTPVAGAILTVEGDNYTSGADGYVTASGYFGAPGGTPLDVDAPGFLPRRTTVGSDRVIALWPVANQAEADAVREMVYRRGQPAGEVLIPPAPDVFYVTLRDTSVDVSHAWGKEAAAFGGIFNLSYELTYSFQYETNETAVMFNNDEKTGCAPIPAWGFCRDPNLYYKIFRVLPEKAVDPGTIRRVLASWFLGPNPLPGFMNAEAPADSLSPLEMQTIRMILQRRLENRWPDTDR